MTEDSQGGEIGLKLQDVLTLFSVGSGLSLFLAITYNIGYFSTLGIFNAEILSPSDIFSSAVAWLPISVLWMGIGWLGAVAIRRVEKRVDKRLGIDRSKTTLAEDFGWNPVYVTILCGGFLIGFIFTDYPRWPSMLSMAMVLIWCPVAFLTMERWGWFKTRHMGTIQSVAMGPVVASIIFAGGNGKALADIHAPELPTLLELRTSDNKTFPVYLLRSLDRGVLARSKATKKITFVRWDQVAEISAPYSTYDDRSLWCRYIRWNCSGPSPAS